jgi:hypothetical protein
VAGKVLRPDILVVEFGNDRPIGDQVRQQGGPDGDEPLDEPRHRVEPVARDRRDTSQGQFQRDGSGCDQRRVGLAEGLPFAGLVEDDLGFFDPAGNGSFDYARDMRHRRQQQAHAVAARTQHRNSLAEHAD